MKASKFLSAISRVAIMTVSVVAATYASATESVTSGFEPAADRE